jgi:hypothetical protein
MRYALAIILLSAGLARQARCQQDSIESSARKVKFEVTLTNHVAPLGSTSFVHCRFSNTSTNTILIYDTGGAEYDSVLWLTDSTGKALRPSPPVENRPVLRSLSMSINPGKTIEYDVNLRLRADLTPGKHTLQARRRFVVRLQGKFSPMLEANSNPVELQINKQGDGP